MVSEVITPFALKPRDPDDAIDAYAALEFGDGAELRRNLLGRLDDDTGHQQIALSDIGTEQPAYFTPAMIGWYADNIAFLRSQAIERVRTALESDKPTGGSNGCLAEGERQKIEDRYIEECRQARRLIRQQRSTEQTKIDELDREIAQNGEEYAALRSNLGREPIIPSHFLYWGLMFLVGVAESFINFDAFRSLSWGTPFYATGVTVLIGMMIAICAHIHGAFWKQFRSYFDDDIDPSRRWVAARISGLALLGVIAALSWVGYARDVFFLQTALGNAAFGDTASATQRLWIVGGSLLGNLIVYLFGVILAYIMHDEVARFAKLKDMLDRDKEKRADLLAGINNEVAAKTRAAVARRKRALEHLDNRDMAQRSAPNYAANRELFELIASQDQRVLGALHAYRSQLCQQKKASGEVFARNDEDDRDRTILIDAAAYQLLPLALRYV